MRLIDADAAIDALNQLRETTYATDYGIVDCDDAISAIATLPTIQPQTGKWIPCSERLPKNECKKYWVCTDTGYQCECRWTNVNPIWTDLTTDWHWNIFDTPQYTKVVAWMPLPEPYEEKK